MFKKSLSELSYLFIGMVLVLLSLVSTSIIRINLFSIKADVNVSFFFILAGLLFIYYTGVSWEMNKKGRTLNQGYFKVHFFTSLLSIFVAVLVGYLLTRSMSTAIHSVTSKKLFVLSFTEPLDFVFILSITIAILVQVLFFVNVRKDKQRIRVKKTCKKKIESYLIS